MRCFNDKREGLWFSWWYIWLASLAYTLLLGLLAEIRKHILRHRYGLQHWARETVADNPMPLSVQAKPFSLYCSLTYVILPFSLYSLCEVSIKSNNTAFVCTAPRSPMHGCWRINSSCQDHFPLITKHPPWSLMRCGCMERGTHSDSIEYLLSYSNLPLIIGRER